MDPIVRVAVIVVAIALVFVLLYVNRYVAKHYWLTAIEDMEDAESTDE